MFAIIYRWQLKPGTEDKFRAAWKQGTKDIEELFGSGGSRLHRVSDGSWLAYARWPNEQVWNEAFRDGPPSAAVAEIQKYIEKEVDQISLEITDDLLIPEPQLEFGMG